MADTKTVALDFGDLTDFTGFMLTRARSRIQSQLEVALDDLPLTSVAYALLSVIRGNPGVMQNDISAGLRLQKSTIANALRDLESRGLIVRDESDLDRRRRVIRLTEMGEHNLALAHERIVKVEAIVDELCAELGLTHFKDDLRRLTAALDALSAA